MVWTSRLMSPISSRKSVPPLACSNRPTRSRSAPVKAPRTWPNSSLSSRLCDSAAQWTLTNGRAARGLARWIAAASSSLPVPLSPRIRTADGLAATLRAIAIIRRTAWPEPLIASKTPASPSASPGRCGPPARRRGRTPRAPPGPGAAPGGCRIRRCCSAILSTLSRSSWFRLSSVSWMSAECSDQRGDRAERAEERHLLVLVRHPAPLGPQHEQAGEHARRSPGRRPPRPPARSSRR